MWLIGVCLLFVSGAAAALNFRCHGYQINDATFNADGRAMLRLSRRQPRDRVEDPRCAQLGPDYAKLSVEASVDSSIARVVIGDELKRRFVVPENVVPRGLNQNLDQKLDQKLDQEWNQELNQELNSDDIRASGNEIQFHNGKDGQLQLRFTQDPFGFAVMRAENNGEITTLVNSTAGGLIFKEQLAEISFQVPENANIYGLGEVTTGFPRDPNRTRTAIWSRDAPDPPNENIYGAHPFYMEVRDGRAHGLLLLNANGMDVILSPGFVTYRVLGGVLEFYVLAGPTPGDVVRQYLSIVGRPAMMPYWSFGWHQCRWGYRTLDEVKTVVRRYNESGIPLETMWFDIDYMDGYRDFTYDPVRFPLDRLQEFRNELNERGQKMVLIVDPGIKMVQGNPIYERGLEAGVYIKNPRNNNQSFVGDVWPGKTVFPDWFNPGTQQWWTEEIRRWYDQVSLDGLWLDMNEIANFCMGDCNTPTPTVEQTNRIDYSRFTGVGEFGTAFNPHYPPYKIDNGGKGQELPLEHRTAPMDAVHYGDLLEYFVHNLYGRMEVETTYHSLKKLQPNRRPFILTRSSFAGSGRFAAHWLGDNWSTWESMRYSLPGLMNFAGLFGMPMVGADICGFLENAEEELCVRWTQLGAVAYPFARNHNYDQGKPQEPYLWESVTRASKKYLHGVRYKLLPYWYTLFSRAHHFGEAAIVRPLLFEFADGRSPVSSAYDAQEVLAIDRQILVGPGLLVSPVLDPGAQSVKAFFPRGTWYEYFSGQLTADNREQGQWMEVNAPLDVIPLHVRGGHLMPRHAIIEDRYTTDALIADRSYELFGAVDAYVVDRTGPGPMLQVATGHLHFDRENGLPEGLKVNIEFEVRLNRSRIMQYRTSEGVLMEMPVYQLWFACKLDAPESEFANVNKISLDSIRIYGVLDALEVYESIVDPRPVFKSFVLQRAVTHSPPSSSRGFRLHQFTANGVPSSNNASLDENKNIFTVKWEQGAGLNVLENWKIVAAIAGRSRPVVKVQ